MKYQALSIADCQLPIAHWFSYIRFLFHNYIYYKINS